MTSLTILILDTWERELGRRSMSWREKIALRMWANGERAWWITCTGQPQPPPQEKKLWLSGLLWPTIYGCSHPLQCPVSMLSTRASGWGKSKAVAQTNSTIFKGHGENSPTVPHVLHRGISQPVHRVLSEKWGLFLERNDGQVTNLSSEQAQVTIFQDDIRN